MDLGELLEEKIKESVDSYFNPQLAIIIQPDSYTQTIKALTRSLLDVKTEGIYVTISRPARSIQRILKGEIKNKANLLNYIDAISYFVGASVMQSYNVQYVDSPSNLEMILTKILWMNRRGSIPLEEKFIVLDSINAMKTYLRENKEILDQFLHVLYTKMREEGVTTAVISIGKPEEDILNMMRSYGCDDVIDLTAEGLKKRDSVYSI